MVNIDLQLDVLRLVDDRLAPHGWEQLSGQAKFKQPIAPEINARIDYTFAFYSNPLSASVTPYIAVLHRAIEEARRFITGRSLYTINIQLQSLIGDAFAHQRWIFVPEDDMAEAADFLVRDSLDYAPLFYEKFRTMEDITRGLEEIVKGKRTIMRESLAIAYCIQGRLDEALDVLADDIAAMRSNPADVANERLPKYTELFGLNFQL